MSGGTNDVAGWSIPDASTHKMKAGAGAPEQRDMRDTGEDTGGDEDYAESAVVCPKVVAPQRSYSVSQDYWTLHNTFAMSEDGENTLFTLIRTIFSTSNEIAMHNPSGDVVATVQKVGGKLRFEDCAGSTLAIFEMREDPVHFGGPPSYDIQTANAEVIGRTSVSDASFSMSQVVNVTIEDTKGNIYARLRQSRPWSTTHTLVQVIDPTAEFSTGVNPREDFRVLSLFAASRFGAPSSAFFFVGPLPLTLLFVMSFCLCGGCAAAAARRGLSRRMDYNRAKMPMEAEQEYRRSNGWMLCCRTSPRYEGRILPWN